MEQTSNRLPVELPGFSGPLDLLVHLISKHEMDVCTISISKITDDYLQIVKKAEEKDLDEAGEYLVLAAALIRYKTRALIPKEKDEPEEEEIDDQIIEQRRQEYERFRSLAEQLRIREKENAAIFPRVGTPPEGQGEVIEYTEVSVYDLHQTFKKIIEEIGDEESHIVAGENYSVDEKILEIEALISHNEQIVLLEYLKTLTSKLEVIVVFLALLEMVRLREVKASQEKIHGEILLIRGDRFKMPREDDENAYDDDDYDTEEENYESYEINEDELKNIESSPSQDEEE